jgi:hypothetical protein
LILLLGLSIPLGYLLRLILRRETT